MIKKIKNYLVDDKFTINIIDDKINIVNYTDIISIENERISVSNNDKIIVIKGKNLTLNKLLEKEILITGIIKLISWSD